MLNKLRKLKVKMDDNYNLLGNYNGYDYVLIKTLEHLKNTNKLTPTIKSEFKNWL